MPAFRRLLPLLALFPLLPAAAGVSHYQGQAYAAHGGRLLYSESHWIERTADGRSRRLVLYRCPDGRAFARKTVRVDGTPQAPDFQLDDARVGYREGVRGDGRQRQVFVSERHGADQRSAALPVHADTVIDAGFDAFIRGHWKALLARGHLRLKMLIPSRLETMAFRVVDEGARRVDGRPARRFRLRADAWYGFALPHIDVDYDATTHRLLRYRGLSNLRNADGDNVDVRIEFPPADAPQPATTAAMAAAAAAALDGRCRL